MRYSRALLVPAAMFALVGCSSGPRYCPYCGADLKTSPRTSSAVTATAAPTAATPASVGTVYRLAPAKVFELAQQALKENGLTIASANGGLIQTDWKAYEGEFHIARRWQEQTRYRVSVIPDATDPVNAARFEVTEETQRRSNAKANWSPAEPRPQRAIEIAKLIAAKLR